jgi:hypothetical protein
MHRFRAPEWYIPIFMLVLLVAAAVSAMLPKEQQLELSGLVGDQAVPPAPAPVNLVDASGLQ